VISDLLDAIDDLFASEDKLGRAWALKCIKANMVSIRMQAHDEQLRDLAGGSIAVFWRSPSELAANDRNGR
jgi:hypothetical protein